MDFRISMKIGRNVDFATKEEAYEFWEKFVENNQDPDIKDGVYHFQRHLNGKWITLKEQTIDADGDQEGQYRIIMNTIKGKKDKEFKSRKKAYEYWNKKVESGIADEGEYKIQKNFGVDCWLNLEEKLVEPSVEKEVLMHIYICNTLGEETLEFKSQEEAYAHWHANFQDATLEDGLYQLKKQFEGDQWITLEERSVIFT